MEKKIKSVKLALDYSTPEATLKMGTPLKHINDYWCLSDCIYFTEKQILDEYPNWFEITYEDPKPERVSNIFKIENDRPDMINANIVRLALEKILEGNYNLSVTKLTPCKSKQELVDKVNKLQASGYYASVSREDVINLINSSHICGGWDDADMKEFAIFNETNHNYTPDNFEDFKKLRFQM